MSGRLYQGRPQPLRGPASGAAAGATIFVDGEDSAGAMAAPATSLPRSSSPPFGVNGSMPPLQRFVKAKAKINTIYEEINGYVWEASRFLNLFASAQSSGSFLSLHSAADAANGRLVKKGGPKSGEGNSNHDGEGDDGGPVVDQECVAKVESYGRQVEAIRQVLSRDHMKVVFFGRTSNGKSTAINALLGERILPTGIGHTTSCFLQVEGGDEPEPYLIAEGDGGDLERSQDPSQEGDHHHRHGGKTGANSSSSTSNQRRSIQSISQLGNALSSEKLEPSAKVRIVWPKEKCKMLGDEVVIIDSPGIDVETDLDAWIDRVCLDSDVFVLVANAESTIMLTEKKFFHKVSERLSKPNVFVVHNRSDAFAGEDMVNEVRAQHTERAVKFLVEELKVCGSRREAEDRIFFVSSKEALAARLQEAKGLPPQISTEDFFPRYLEFQAFEKRFTDCLSRAAINTKFAQHSKQGHQIIKEVAAVMAAVNMRAVAEHQLQLTTRRELWDRQDFVLKQLEMMTLDMKDKIRSITEDVEFKVGKAMSEEIRRLSVLVDEFNDPFHPDPLVLNVYRSRLNHHIEAGIGSNLKTRLSSDLQVNIESHEKEMIERMSGLLPPDKQLISRNILPRRDTFEVLYHLNFDNLCADFQEDIRFKFSLGVPSLINKLAAVSGGQRTTALRNSRTSGSRRTMMSRHDESTYSPISSSSPINRDDEWSVATKVALAAVGSHGTMGGLLVGGLLLKAVGWRAIFAATALYGGIYMYERLTWTNTAKCREFKRQYVEHAARKLRLVVDMTSANCSHQVQQELSSTFARLCHLVDETTAELKDGIDRVEASMKRLDDGANRSKVLKNKASFIANKLELFDRTFLVGTAGSVGGSIGGNVSPPIGSSMEEGNN